MLDEGFDTLSDKEKTWVPTPPGTDEGADELGSIPGTIMLFSASDWEATGSSILLSISSCCCAVPDIWIDNSGWGIS